MATVKPDTGEIRYLNPPMLEVTNVKYCRFKKMRWNYIDYKDPDYLLRFVNDQGKLLPRRLSGNSVKFQRRVAQAVKRARHLALMPFVADGLK
jgi:small subunit ribosomal protein S18